MRCVRIEKPADHALILCVILLGFTLEEFNTPLAQRDRDLDPLFPKDEILRSRKKVRNDFHPSQGFVRISDFRAHKFVFPFANNQHQVSELRSRGT